MKEAHIWYLDPVEMEYASVARNLAFDVADWKLVSATITEKGILKLTKIKRMLV